MRSANNVDSTGRGTLDKGVRAGRPEGLPLYFRYELEYLRVTVFSN